MGSSARDFGFVFAGGFALVGLFPLLGDETPGGWVLAAAGTAPVTVPFKPAWLAPCNRSWFRCGRGLQRIVHSVVRGAACFAAATPTGLVLRTLGKDPLGLRCAPDAESYWI